VTTTHSSKRSDLTLLITFPHLCGNLHAAGSTPAPKLDKCITGKWLYKYINITHCSSNENVLHWYVLGGKGKSGRYMI